MLRSTVVQSDNSVYDACWSPDSQSIAYPQGKSIVVKYLAPNTKPVKVINKNCYKLTIDFFSLLF